MFAIGKRIFLFLLTNILIVVTISIILQLLGVGPYLDRNGLNYTSLAVFCLVWGFGGAFISLALSRVMAKWMGIQLIKKANNETEQWLLGTVSRYAKTAGISGMPEVGIYNSPELNAFATGPTKNRSLIAVSTGLLNSMGRKEVEGVIGHEMGHITSGDMVTMTLLQGVVNSFVMFFARVISFAVSQTVKENQQRMVRFFVTILLEIVLGILGSMIVAYFSRIREFRADRWGAKLAGRQNMIGALEVLQKRFEPIDNAHPSLATMKISGKSGGFLALFATHPPLQERIKRLSTQAI